MVPKTDCETYVSISIGKYIIKLTCFLHCAKGGYFVENVESEDATWKIVIEEISMLKWQKIQGQIFQSVLITPCCFIEKKTPNFLK